MKKLIVFLLLFASAFCTIQKVEITGNNVSGTVTQPVTLPVTITPVTIPAAPVVSISSGNSQLVLTWPNVTDAVSYNVYRGSTTGVTALNGIKFTGKTSPYTDVGLTNGLSYYYIVTAVNTAGESAVSNEVKSTAGIIDNNDGTVYIAALNQTWTKCEQVDVFGNNRYNPTNKDCSNGTSGTFQYCSVNTNVCSDLFFLNGGGSSGMWQTCNNLTIGGKSWRVPNSVELTQFASYYALNQPLISQVPTWYYWASEDFDNPNFNYAFKIVDITNGNVVLPGQRTQLWYARCMRSGI